MRVVIIALMLVLGVVPAVGAQGGAKLTDVVICNDEAHRRAGSPSASARTGERPRTVTPEKGTETDPSGSIVAKSDDPLLEGMATEGLGDPAYRTAYRECMAGRRKQ